MRFVIMGSVFYTHNFIHAKYDLKGSLEGRKASEKEKQQEVPVFKDLDFLEGKMKIRIDADRSRLLVEQLKRDSNVIFIYLFNIFLTCALLVSAKTRHHGL
jgi:hypothetical protein